MKKLLLVAVTIMLLFAFTSCGTNTDTLIDKVFDYAKKELDWVELEISYDDDFEYEFEGFDGITMIAWVDGEDYYEGAIIEFESVDDAKEAYETFEDEEYYDYYDKILRKDKVVIAGSDEFVDSLK